MRPHSADQVRTDVDAVELLEMRPDVSDRHPARVHRDDFVGETVEVTLVLPYDLRLERAFAFPRHLDIYRADVVRTALSPLPLRSLASPSAPDQGS